MFDEILQQSPDNIDNQHPIEQKDSKLVQKRSESILKQPEGDIKVRQLSKIGEKKKIKLLLLVIIAILLIILGGGYFYYAKGEALLLSKNMKWEWGNKTENYYTESSLSLKIKNINLKDQFSNVFLMMDSIPESLQLGFNSNFKVIEKNGEGFLVLELDFGPKLDLNLDFKKIDQDLYLKFKTTGLSEIIPFVTISDIDSKDGWIWIELGEQNFPLDVFNTLGSDSAFEDLEEKIPVFLDTLKKENIFGIKDPHQVKDLDDFKLKKIEYFIREDKIDDFVFSSIDVFSKDEDKAHKQKEEFIQNKIEKHEEWENIKNFIKNSKISLWIDTQNKIIKGIDFNLNDFEIDTKNFALSLDLEFSNFIGDIIETEILVPDNYISVEEFIQEIEEQIYPPGIKQDELTEIDDINRDTDTDGDGLLDYIEQAIGTDVNNQDTDGDGYLDLEEIKDGYNPLEASDEKLDPEILDFYNQLIEEGNKSIIEEGPISVPKINELPF